MFKVCLNTFLWMLLTASMVAVGSTASACSDNLQASAEHVVAVNFVESAVVSNVSLSDEAPCSTVDHWSVLPSAIGLAKTLVADDVQVLDIRSAGLRAHGMLPGTTVVEYPDWRGDKAAAGLPPTDDYLSEVVGNAGLLLDLPIVIVDHEDGTTDMARAAYVYWILKSLGAEKLAILRGGYKAWEETGLPTRSQAQERAPYLAEVTFDDEHLASDYEIFGIAMMQIEGRLLDVRPEGVVNRFDSQGRAIPTTLPGAQNAPVANLATQISSAHSIEGGARAVLAHLKAHRAASVPIVTFSSTGELAALNWFFASQVAGLADVRVYPEGVRGWKARDGKLFRAANAYEMKAAK